MSRRIISPRSTPLTHKKSYSQNILNAVNNHLGLISFTFTILSAFIVGYIKICMYAFERGKCLYLKVDHSYISISDANLYNILFYFSIVVIIIGLNTALYFVCKKGSGFMTKLVKISSLIVLIALMLALLVFIPLIKTNYTSFYEMFCDITIMKQIILGSLLLTILLCSLCISVLLSEKIAPIIEKRLNSQQTENTSNHLFSLQNIIAYCSSITIVFAMSIVLCAHAGYSTAQDTKTYRIIENKYVVLFENEDTFLVSNYTLTEEKPSQETILNISNSTRTVISKEDITTTSITFDKVDLNSLPDLENTSSISP